MGCVKFGFAELQQLSVGQLFLADISHFEIIMTIVIDKFFSCG